MNVVLAPIGTNTKWLDVFAFDDRQAGAAEMRSIVSGVQFPAEMPRPARIAGEGRKERRGALGNGDVQRRAQLGNRQCIARQPFDQRRGERDAKPVRECDTILLAVECGHI